MTDDSFQTPFSMALLTSVFVGFVTTILCLIYNLIFRDETGFPLASFINVSTLIFSVNLLFVIIGLIYSLFAKESKGPEFIFIAIFILLTVLGSIKAGSAISSQGHELTSQLRGLLLGIVIIIGLGSLSVPFLFHNKKFKQNVL